MIYECNNCAELFGSDELHNHHPDDTLWCRHCLEIEYEEMSIAVTYARLATAGLAHCFESADTMVSQ